MHARRRRTSQSPSLSNSECWHFVCMCICLQKCDIPYRLRKYCKLLNLKNNSDPLWAVQLAVQVVQKMSKRKWNQRKRPSACWRRWKARSQAAQSRCTDCCKAHAKINRKMGNTTPCKIVTPKNFILKLCTRDYVGEVTRHTNFGFNRYSGGFSPNRRNITTLWLFDCPVLSCPYLFARSYAQVEPQDRFSRFMAQTTCFSARMAHLGVRTMGDHIWGKYAPKTPQKWAWVGNFQPKRQNIKIAISPKL